MIAINKVMYEVLYRISKPRWDDNSIPSQVDRLGAEIGNNATVLDLGCGTGTHSIYLSQRGYKVTGVDFSPTAIRRAREKATRAGVSPEFIVGDVTRLDFLRGPFDLALDVGCLHGLNASAKVRYAQGLSRLMKSGGTLLIWGMVPQRSGLSLTPEEMEKTFSPWFRLERSESDRLHQQPAKWYWLKKM